MIVGSLLIEVLYRGFIRGNARTSSLPTAFRND
jgi:hypothetical protein